LRRLATNQWEAATATRLLPMNQTLSDEIAQSVRHCAKQKPRVYDQMAPVFWSNPQEQ
jgi:hypothetical protein